MQNVKQLAVGVANVDPEDTLTRGGYYVLRQRQNAPQGKPIGVEVRYATPGGEWKTLRNAGVSALDISSRTSGFVAVSGTTHPFVCCLWDGTMLHNTDRITPPRQGPAVWSRVPPGISIQCVPAGDIKVRETVTLAPAEGILNSFRLRSSGTERFAALGFLPLQPTRRGFTGLICQAEAPYLVEAHLTKPNSKGRVILTLT